MCCAVIFDIVGSLRLIQDISVGNISEIEKKYLAPWVAIRGFKVLCLFKTININNYLIIIKVEYLILFDFAFPYDVVLT